jgi:hypothetical protein
MYNVVRLLSFMLLPQSDSEEELEQAAGGAGSDAELDAKFNKLTAALLEDVRYSQLVWL